MAEERTEVPSVLPVVVELVKTTIRHAVSGTGVAVAADAVLTGQQLDVFSSVTAQIVVGLGLSAVALLQSYWSKWKAARKAAQTKASAAK